MVSDRYCLCKYTVDRKFVETRAGKHVNFPPARRATARVGGAGKQHDNRMTAGCGNVRGAGVIPDGEKSRIGEIGEAGETGTADEVDGLWASCADLGRQQLFASGADNDRKSGGCLK